MEIVLLDSDLGQFLVTDLDSGGVLSGIQFGANPQAGVRRRFGDEVHNHLMADQRLATPVLCDVAKEAMFDLVPFAGSRRAAAGWRAGANNPALSMSPRLFSTTRKGTGPPKTHDDAPFTGESSDVVLVSHFSEPPTPLEDLSGSIYKNFLESGMTDDELSEELERAKHEMRAERRARRPS